LPYMYVLHSGHLNFWEYTFCFGASCLIFLFLVGVGALDVEGRFL
jgi:hypothetical protein